MQKWQYEQIPMIMGKSAKAGMDGWELVAVQVVESIWLLTTFR